MGETGLVRGRASVGRCMAATEPGREEDMHYPGVNKVDSIMCKKGIAESQQDGVQVSCLEEGA